MWGAPSSLQLPDCQWLYSLMVPQHLGFLLHAVCLL